jgi:hypothetical protein
MWRCGDANLCRPGSRAEFAGDFPVVAERVNDAANAPTVLFGDGRDFLGTGFDGALEHGVWIRNGENHADGATVQGFRAEIFVFEGFVTEPEFGAVHGEARDDAPVGGIQAKNFGGAKRGFVKVHGLCAVANGQPGRNGNGFRNG